MDLPHYSTFRQSNRLEWWAKGHRQCRFKQSLRVLVEPPNKWKGCLLSARLHGGITSVSRLVVPALSLWSMTGVESHSTHLSVIFSGGAQIHKHLHVAFSRLPGFQSWENRSDKEKKSCACTTTIIIFHEVLVKYWVCLHNVLCRG